MEDLNVAWIKKYRTKNKKKYIYKDKKTYFNSQNIYGKNIFSYFLTID